MKTNDKQKIIELEKELLNYKTATFCILIGLIASLMILGLIASSNYNFKKENQQLKLENMGYTEYQKSNCLNKRNLEYWYNNGKGWKFEDVNQTKLNDIIKCLKQEMIK